jgi:hypothetical protein
MSSYAKYCREQAADCARRARIASSPEIVATCRALQERWLKLADKAQSDHRPRGRIDRLGVGRTLSVEQPERD